MSLLSGDSNHTTHVVSANIAQLLYVIAYLKSYYASTCVCLGSLLNLATLVAINADRSRWSTGARLEHSIAAAGNLVILILRASVNYWWGDGLFFSTGGAVYVYLDQIDEAVCKTFRGLSALGEITASGVTVYETVSVLNNLCGRKVNNARIAAALLVYGLVTGAVSAVQCYYAVEIGGHPTAISGMSCSLDYVPRLNQILIITAQTMMYGVPVAAMFCVFNVTLALSCVIAKNKTRLALENRPLACVLKRRQVVVLAKASVYCIFLFLIFFLMILRIRDVDLTGADASESHSYSTISFILAFILPSVDFFALLGGEAKFARSLKDTILCRCFSLSQAPPLQVAQPTILRKYTQAEAHAESFNKCI